jgi:3-oxoacyl-[acyl-carrier protein] reductase
LVDHYLGSGFEVIGCSRNGGEDRERYSHHCVDVADEVQVTRLFGELRGSRRRLDVLINNAGIAAMNHSLLTPGSTVRRLFETNVLGTFLFAREAAKMMRRTGGGRIVNLASVATPLKTEGEAVYAASKAAVVSLTEVMARELAEFGITVNAVGPAPIRTQLTANIPEDRIQRLLDRLAIKAWGEVSDVANVIDFFIRPESHAVTGQTVFLGGA